MAEKTLPRSLGIGAGVESLGVTNAIRDPAEYIGRSGYLSDFVDGADIALPAFQDGYDDVAVVDCPDRPGEIVYDLRYTHFSVVICKSRRMPFFSCVNLDGTQEKRGMGDGTWRKDPRVDANIQIIVDGVYGGSREGLFSRGHMTRREDPNWGAPAVAKKANEDTFHVTNACPQVQGFNAPIWLLLEDHVKNNAWADNMKISVMTGPIFAHDDPLYRPRGFPEVKVPAEFWKVVIFKHDDTGDVVATAYKTSQLAKLPRKNMVNPQFVFGAFDEYQMKISDLEQETRLDFGPLRDMDVLGELSDGVVLQHASLHDVIFAR